MSSRCGVKSCLPCFLAVKPRARHAALSLSFPFCRAGMLTARTPLGWCWGFEMMCGSSWHQEGPRDWRCLTPVPCQSCLGRGQEGGSLGHALGSAFWAEPRDFCEDSWPLAGDEFSFGLLTGVV